MKGTIRTFLVAVLFFAFAPVAHGATRYVSSTGTNTGSCGVDSLSACRSISKAIELAAPGDTVLVSPGLYGDLDRDGSLGGPGEELGYLTPPASCSCVLRIDKPVIVISSAGAAVTMIDGRSVDVIQNVLILTDGGEFGRPGKGFTVTETGHRDGAGRSLGEGIVLAVDSGNAMVRGNQVLFTRTDAAAVSLGTGILTVTDAAIRIEGNLVMGWERGISARGAATVSKNQVIRNGLGIAATGGTVVGNVATVNHTGIFVSGTAHVVSNASYMNDAYGIEVVAVGFSGVVTKNNLFGNHVCGLQNDGTAGLLATNNYWGTAAGPGAPPADSGCNGFGATTTTSPFATKPFPVKPLKP